MNTLFNDFEGVSAKQWKQKIQMDLKGADYNETLIWQSLEGINVKPFYHRDDAKSEYTIIPGHPDSWHVCQHVFIDDTVIANKLALNNLQRGAEAIYFSAEKEFNVASVFQDFPFEKASIYLNLTFLSETFLKQLKQFFSEKNAIVYYNIDIIKNFAVDGNWFHNLKEDHAVLDSIISKASEKEAILSIDIGVYQNAGANMIQQLAYAMSHANEYLNHFSNSTNFKEHTITFHVAVGSNYFFEIAKIRALRLLFATLASEYHVKETCHIIASPSKRNKTLYDYNINMLRTTTECMSAILGGANTIINLPYDSLYHKSNEFGERISRNQLLILKAESYFDMVSNPADGSYYVESITNELAQKALELFKNIEKGGGFVNQLKDGTIQKKIHENASKEQKLFDEGILKLVGTNFQQNKNDRMKNDLELYPFRKIKPRKTIISPIITTRISEKIEKQRLEHE